MANSRFAIMQAAAVKDKRVSDAQFRTLAALGMYADKNGWCYPSLKTLGRDLSKSKQAVGRDTIALRKLGYLEVKNRYDSKTKSRHSNLYRLKFDLPDVNVDDSTLSTSEVDTLSTSEVDVNVPINAPINEDVNERTALLSKLYQSNITALTPMSVEMLKDIATEFECADWYTDAFKIAVENNSRNLKYIYAILRNWKEKGRDYMPTFKKPGRSAVQENKSRRPALVMINNEVENV